MDVDSELLQGPLDLLKSNDPPKISQVQVLEAFRACYREKIVSVDAQILELESKIANLAQTRSNLVSKLEVCTRILSPIRRLPAEIIQEIFRFCLPKRRERTSSRLQAPIVLCQICSTWRRIALGFSALWEELAVCVNYANVSNEELVRKRITAVGEWFSRASPEALLDYSCDTHFSEHTGDEAPQMISEVLLPYIHRCCTLDMSPSNVADIQSFLRLSSDHIPHLEQVVLRFDIARAGTTPTVFSTASSLRELSMRYFMFYEASDPIDYMVVFPWKQLTFINMVAVPPSIWATIFRQCHALQVGIFVLQENQATPKIHPKLTPTTFASLESLTMVCRGPAKVINLGAGSSELPPWLFDGLDFPILSKLHFVVENQGKWFDTASLSHLPSLKSLSFLNDCVTAKKLVSLLRASPTVTELLLRNYDSKLPLRALSYKPGSEFLLPKLERITVQIGWSTFMDYQLLRKMIKSRLSTENHSLLSSSSLCTVSFVVADKWSPEIQHVQVELQNYKPDLIVNLTVVPYTHKRGPLEEY